MYRVVVATAVGLFCIGCVTRGSFDELLLQHEETLAERDALASRVERLEIERNSFEDQYLDTMDSYEDERVTRRRLATDLALVEKKATQLDQALETERLARVEMATTLANRETQFASMQYTYDQLVSGLESEVSSGQIEIERLREGLRLNVSQEILFASGSAKLDPIGRDVLVKVAGRLKELGDFVEVRGHTDDRRIRDSLSKQFPSNWELAAARAASVVRLLEDHGVPGDRLAAVSLGQHDPIVPNDSAENRLRNRRIEIRLEPRASTGRDSDSDD